MNDRRLLGYSRVCFSLLLVGLHSLCAQDFEPIRDSIRAQMVQGNVPSIAVAVAKGDKILWEEGFGWADREKRVPADANTMYSLASISKPLTATALMTLVKAGKIDLDSPINDYLGTSKLRARIGDAQQATVRRVANHSSGLPEYCQFFYENEQWRPPSPDETIRKFGNLVAIPGEHFEYSNLGYGVLSYVISRVSGKTFADYMREEVFLKLGMTRTSVNTPPDLAAFQAVRYDGEDLVPIVPYVTDHDGASAIYSSVHDMIRFGMFQLKAHLPDQVAILPDSMIDAMQVPTMPEWPGAGYGIGWERKTLSGYTIVSHSGGMPGVGTWLRLVPSEKLAVVVLCNEDGYLAHAVSDEIMAAMLPNWKLPASKNSPPPSPFVPPHELLGTWRGKVSTYDADIPLVMTVMVSGEVEVELGDQLKTLLNNPRFVDGFLRGNLTGSIGIQEASRRPYQLSLNLKLRNGNTLNGAVSAETDDSGTMADYNMPSSSVGQPWPARVEKATFVLTQWCELSKE